VLNRERIDIAYVPSDVTLCAWKREGTGFQTGGNIMFGVIENIGDSAFTLACQSSSDNNATDTYTAVNMRINGASVTSVSIPAKSRLEFVIEYQTAFKTEPYIRFTRGASDTPRARMDIFYSGNGGNVLVRRDLINTP
jgi:hypothetical protein